MLKFTKKMTETFRCVAYTKCKVSLSPTKVDGFLKDGLNVPAVKAIKCNRSSSLFKRFI